MKCTDPVLPGLPFAYADGGPRQGRAGEVWTAERCFIRELLNDPDSPDMSIAAARVPAYVTTMLHALRGIAERYVIQSGRGLVEVNGARWEVGPGDVVSIPPDAPQRIANIGGEDLEFLCVCTPRFRPETYRDLER